MAEDHRRVEPRQIVGTGMATDPDRIVRVQQDAERTARAWRDAPEESFGDVLQRAPASTTTALEGAPTTTTAPQPPPPAAAPATTKPSTRITPRAPDPRARQLHALLDAGAAKARVPDTSTDTPPTRPPVTRTTKP